MTLTFTRQTAGCYKHVADGVTYFVVNKTYASQGDAIDDSSWWWYEQNAENCGDPRWTKSEAAKDLEQFIAYRRKEEETKMALTETISIAEFQRRLQEERNITASYRTITDWLNAGRIHGAQQVTLEGDKRPRWEIPATAVQNFERPKMGNQTGKPRHHLGQGGAKRKQKAA
jgi:hypothetical protein